jgi:RHS repeat-associated protein
MANYSGGGSGRDNERSGQALAAPTAPTAASTRDPAERSVGGRPDGLNQPNNAGPGAASPSSSLLPAVSVPQGGGAIRGIGEKFSVSAATGTASLSVPIAASAGRSGFGPAVALAYDSGNGNGPFGLGFQLSIPVVTRKTDKGLPRYLDDAESDEYILAGAEDLVPTLDASGAPLELTRQISGVSYRVRRYRPRVEGAFARIERWIKVLPGDASDGDVHWRITSRDNVTNLYGLTPAARIADPAAPTEGRKARIFSWLLEETHDDKGNTVKYVYKAEDGVGVDRTRLSEKSRFEAGEFVATAQRYLKRVLYCNAAPFDATDFLMELVFDYGEHLPAETTPGAVPTPDEDIPWPTRPDPISSYRPTFEVRTYRLCRRVLMFHRFAPAVGAVRPALLVKSTDFTYEPSAAFTYLAGVTQAGYLNDDSTGNAWQRKTLPTLALDYARPIVNDELRPLPPESLPGLEGGVDGARKQWVDLDGEGIPGVLIDNDSAWLYKANRGNGELAPPRLLRSMPSPVSLAGGLQQLEDLGGDGQLDLVAFGEPLQGYFSRTTEGSFEPLRPFQSIPNIDFNDPNLRSIDLDGDGLPDLLITEDHAFVWYRSRGKAGFDPLRRLVVPTDEDKGPAVVFADPEQTVQLADMSGDGLIDIVRIRNGEISYWPNLGYAKFGNKITLENSPRFANTDQFDARRVRFGDVDGTGTSDVFYLGASETRLYFNQSGNGLSAATPIRSLPPVDNLTSLSIVDLLGQGTACLVWSSPLPARRAVFFVDLMGGKKPHLLKTVANNLGAETKLSYATSTRFYLEDKAAGIPWLTRLSFPVHVVEKIERFDHISKSRLVSTYRYRHGFFDGVEREFRGFARVEQRDAEEFTVGPETELFQAPVKTVSWFHTGAWLEKERLESALALEYFPPGPKTAADLALLVKDTHFDSDTLGTPRTIQDEREAARALRGSMLRQEIYADDADVTGDADKAKRPYVVTEQNFAVRRLQSSSIGSHGVFLTFARESLAIHTERNPEDPRIGHDFVLRVDSYGNVTRKASIAYARQTIPASPPDLSRQGDVWSTLTEALFANRPSPETAANIDEDQRWHRIGVEYETRASELTGLPNLPTGARIYSFETIDQAVESLLTNLTPSNDLPFEDNSLPTGSLRRRLLDRKQQLFYNNALTAPLALGALESLALPYESYQLALTTGIVAQLSAESLALSGTAFDPALLLSEGRYVQRDANYWTASGRVIFDPARFYLPTEAVDPFGEHSFVTYDAFALLITGTRDPLFNTTSAENDYRVLSPSQVTDPNLNRVALAFDALGMVVKTAVMGKAGAAPAEGDTLADPTMRLEYDLLRWQTQQKPSFVHTFAREQHVTVDPASRIQESFTYSDGFGRVAMQKVQAEPEQGTATPRWVGTGRTVFNNKGNPVKQYEPFFSATSDFEDEDAIVQTGVTPIIHYDPLDRVIRTELPDGSESLVEFDPWQQKTFDPNDAIAGTRWLSEHQAGTADEQRAATLALAHADTPTTAHLDSLGRTFLVQADNGPDPATPTGPHRLYDTRTKFDIEGNVLAITDARGVQVIQQRFDVLQRRLRVDSPDAGARLAVADIAGKPLRAWDNRGQTMRSQYDTLQRPTHMFVAQGGTERLLLRTVFGESLDPPGVPIPTSPAQALNLRGKPYLAFDCAGLVTAVTFDFKGNLLASSRRLATDYSTEPNWTATENLTNPAAILTAASPLLEAEHFDNSSTYDALNRVTTHTTPDGSVTTPKYSEANLLQSLLASVPGAPDQIVIAGLNYNARGQRTSCKYGNGTTTTYTYDPKTFRLTELQTLRGTTKLQWLLYTFDPVGNIVALRDQSDTGPVFSGTTPVSGDGLYEYDPLYRLLKASGREHPSTQPIDLDPPAGTGVRHANDLQALLVYSETYVYDRVGNIEQMAHVAGPSGNLGWTRNYQYAANSNRLLKTSVPGSPLNLSETYTYDAHGSMTTMPHLAVMDWDYADRLRHAQKGAGSGAQHTYFTYDAAGQRARKVAVTSGAVKERIYLGGYEVYRERAAAPGAIIDFERQTLHVMDDQRRVAMAETKTREGGVVVPTLTTRWRFQLDNHLGSATLELDASGNVISYEEYHPYGSTAFHTADGAAQVSAKRYRYTGKEKDETGLYYHGARYYAPWLGRWTAADPLTTRQPGTADLCSYSYVGGRPMVAVDPDGQQSAAPRTAADVQSDYRRSQAEPPPPDSLEKAARLHGQTEGRAQTLQRELIELNEARQTGSTARFWSLDHVAASVGIIDPLRSRSEELQSFEASGLTEAGTDNYWHSTVFERAIESGLITSKGDQDRFLQIAEDERRGVIYRWAGWRAVEMALSLTPVKGAGAGGVLLARAPHSTSAALSVLNSAAKAANVAGEYINVIESMSKRAIEFQQLVSKGIKAGTSFLRNGVKFDYVDTARSVLIDAKGPGYGNFVDKAGKFYDWFKGSGALVEQARRQVRAAGGTAIEWVFAEEKALRATQTLLDGAGIQGITLRLFK